MNTRRLSPIILCLLFNLLAFSHLLAQAPDYPALKTKAEALFTEGSFAKANEIYQQAKTLPLSPAQKRWVDFRLADTLWRSQAATTTADNTQLERAQHELEVLVRDVTRVEDRDRVWAETQESLGDYFWTRRHMQNWGAAWPYYKNALDWWAGAQDIELARQRYIKIIWTIARPPQAEPYYYYGYFGNMLPLDILENVLKIAKTDEDKAHAHYLIAMTLRNQGSGWEQGHRVPQEFEAALQSGKKTEWYDDALYNYAEWMMNQGRVVILRDATWSREPDYPKALELFRRIVSEYKKGETRYYEQARQQIKNITDPQVSVAVANIFLPDSEIQFGLNWRNVKRVEFALYPVDLTRDVQLSEDPNRNDWLNSIKLEGLKSVNSWSRETKDDGKYKPGNETVRVDKKLAPGAYVLEAKGNGKKSRDLVLVTDASIVLKTSGKQALVYVCNALAGSPLSEAHVQLWEHHHDGSNWHWRESSKNANADGIAIFDLYKSNNQQIFASAISKDRQAFALGNSYYHDNRSNQGKLWKIYAFTDRPAYRPKETVEWKFIARRDDGAVYSTPSGETVQFEITDPRGAKVKEDKATLNAFGSAWGSLELTESMPLGEYRVTFWDQEHHHQIGYATLFRLEEYKLPEFKVSVQTPEEDGRKKAFRLGEKVEVIIQADYYFGGPVSSASVELIVYQNPFYHIWHRPHPYPWYYEDQSSSQRGRHWGGGDGQIIKRETLKTDVNGKASLTFDTPANAGQDFEYRIEARVTDASRREIIGNGTVRVTQQRYYVYPDTEHKLYRPQDKLTVTFKALDANEQPVQTEGTVKVTRDYWFEIWLDPNGREVKGEELKRFRAKHPIFPPAPPAGNHPWQLKFQGYEKDEILTRVVKTDTNGVGQLTFTPEREGYYRIAWSSEDNANTNALPAPPIKAETTVWVARNATTELGYRSGGVEIIVDKDTFRVGQKAPIMLSVPTSDRYVLFSVEGSDLYSYQLVHVTGDVKLIELPIEEKHVPNIFLNAALVSDRQFFTDNKEVIVPPTKNFLTVDIKPDREQYQPREEGNFTITTLNHENKPVPAEVSFGLVDDSVYYIQSDYAGDPRQFYFGTKRQHQIQTRSTFNQKSYTKLVEDENQLIDERDKARASRQAGHFEAINGFEERDALRVTRDDISGRRGGGDTRMRGLYKAKGEWLAMDAIAPVPAVAPMAQSMSGGKLTLEARFAEAKADKQSNLSAGEEPAVQVRSDFRSTILWKPDVTTGSDGKATVKVKYPDSLTGWKTTVRAVTEGNQFGIASTNTRTKQPLIVRLQAPRFFVVGDVVTISAVINNNTDKPLEVAPKLEAEGLVISGLYVTNGVVVKGERVATIQVAANGEARADWAVTVTKEGTAKLKVTGRGGKYADAMEKTYTIYEHGIEKFISKSGKVRGNDVTVKLDLPKERKADSTTLTVQVSPSMAVTMLDALPYLIDYPHGCTEQTMSRFLPAAITAKTLSDLGLQPADIMGHVFGGIEPAGAAATHPKGKHNLDELNDMVEQGLKRLYDFQHNDGGWGWWKEGQSDHYMSAYVVWGLTLARSADIAVKKDVLDKGVRYLETALVEEELNFDTQAWMLHALAVYHGSSKSTQVGKFQSKAFDNLWNNREKLNAYTRALLSLSAHHFAFSDKAKILVENLENGVKKDDRPDLSVLIGGSSPAKDNSLLATAHWGSDGFYWRWSEGGIEATAFALRALLAIDPKNKLVEPVSNWLIKNRRGAQWSNTRDTAITVLTMNDYLRASGELAADLEYELSVNGHSIATQKVSSANVLKAPSQFAIDPKFIRDGTNDIRIVTRGTKGSIYFAASAKYFSLEEPVTPAGNEIFVRRQYYKLVGRPTLLKGYVYERQPLSDGETVKSGDRVETVLTIEGKNNYEYLVFEDLKPAGFEAVEIRSGEALYAYELKSGAVERKFAASKKTPAAAASKKNPVRGRGKSILPMPRPVTDEDHTGRSQWVYQELRDRKVALFIDKLPEGVWEIKYDMRAETPGRFHALPVVGHAMYVPEIRCNGTEIRVIVEDSK